MAASAYSSCKAAVLLAKVSGSDVPKAMIVIPDTAAFMPNTHPSSVPNCNETQLCDQTVPETFPTVMKHNCVTKQCLRLSQL